MTNPAQGMPTPGPGETIRTKIPDGIDGIKFEIQRLIKYITEGHKDPVVITIAQKIAELSIGTARKLRQKITPLTKDLISLRGIHAWCHAHFEHVPNPVGIEIIKTPRRMLKELAVPLELANAVWEPIRDAMVKDLSKDWSPKLTLPTQKVTGSSGVATCLVLTLCGAIGFDDLRMRFGGHNGTVHYVWSNVHANGKWQDVDILRPKFGTHQEFDCYEIVEIPSFL